MSLQLSENESPQAVEIRRSFGPPLPAQALIFRMPDSTQARVVSVNILVVSAINGALLSSVSLHDTNGATVFTVGCAPVFNNFIFGQAVARATAGPEQNRVPFFQPNILFGSYPKDLYALPGYEFRINNVAGVANRTQDVTLFLSTGNN